MENCIGPFGFHYKQVRNLRMCFSIFILLIFVLISFILLIFILISFTLHSIQVFFWKHVKERLHDMYIEIIRIY